MTEVQNAWQIFEKSITDYHKKNDVDQLEINPYKEGELEFLFYKKNWIDTVQWHLEDIIRDPEINPTEALKIKRRIDASNQDRTDIVENIDAYYLKKFSNISPNPEAQINTESPAWALDRFSILALKVFHMREEVQRKDAEASHKAKCEEKLNVLLEQKSDLTNSITQLLSDISSGKKYMKSYKQMKMYNDESLNPILYSSKKPS